MDLDIWNTFKSLYSTDDENRHYGHKYWCNDKHQDDATSDIIGEAILLR